MSLDLYVFVDRVPDRVAWQAAIDQTRVDLKLDPTLDVGRDEGFLPCELNGKSSGFELSLVPAAEVLGSYPSLKTSVGARLHAMCFRWGGDLVECACVLAATLGLVRGFKGVAYYPSDDLHYDVAGLEKDLRECLTQT
jgi:hypothetical protein